MLERGLIALVAAMSATPAFADVSAASDQGFVSRNTVAVDSAPAEAWPVMLRPQEWWSAAHSYSGDAANLSLVAVAGGCFCEALPGEGSVEHMRVLYVDPRTRTLRLSGALGPLQGEALNGVLTMTIEPAGEGAKITWEYVVGGYARPALRDLAPLVDGVIGEQLARLAERLRRR